jgi:hypothetical protein
VVVKCEHDSLDDYERLTFEELFVIDTNFRFQGVAGMLATIHDLDLHVGESTQPALSSG